MADGIIEARRGAPDDGTRIDRHDRRTRTAPMTRRNATRRRPCVVADRARARHLERLSEALEAVVGNAWSAASSASKTALTCYRAGRPSSAGGATRSGQAELRRQPPGIDKHWRGSLGRCGRMRDRPWLSIFHKAIEPCASLAMGDCGAIRLLSDSQLRAFRFAGRR